MGKIKSLISKMSEDVKILIKKFPLSMAVIVFLTLLGAITVDHDFSKSTEEMIQKIFCFGCIWVIGTVFTETFFTHAKMKKVVSYLATGAISIFFTNIVNLENTSDSVESFIFRSLSSYIIILICLILYQSIKNSEESFGGYWLKLFRSVFNATVTYIILNIGVILVTEIFVELILDGKSGNIELIECILILGLFYVPSFIYSLANINKKEVNTFIKGLILYVFLPLVIIAMAIIYLYIVKIILLKDMPQNTIYRILAGIFIVAFPVWNMAGVYEKEKTSIGKLVKILPYVYAPFIFLEIYSIGTRISSFGVTPLRYASCVFIVLQILALILTFYKNKEKLSYVFILTAIVIFIVFITPLNFERISNLSQQKRLKQIVQKDTHFEDLSKESQAKASGAYQYLKSATDGKRYIPEYLSDEMVEKLNSYNSYSAGNRRYQFIYLNTKLDLELDGYHKISEINIETKNKSTIIKLETGEKVDLEEFVTQLMEKNEISEEKADEYFKQNNIIKVDDKQDIYLTLTNIRYDDEYEIDYLNVEGYLLEK